MFLSKLFKRTRARAITALAGMAMIVGVGAAISSGVSNVQNEVTETKADNTTATIYCAYSGSDALHWYVNKAGDHYEEERGDMTKTDKKWNGVSIYEASITYPYGGLGALKFYHGTNSDWQTVWGDKVWKETNFFNGKVFFYRTDAAGGPYDYAVDETRTIYYAVDRNSVVGSYTVKINLQRSWTGVYTQATMASPTDTHNGLAIYSFAVNNVTAVDNLQFQLYDGETWKSEQWPIHDELKLLTNPEYAGRIYVHNTGWQDYSVDAKTPSEANFYWKWSGEWWITPYIKYLSSNGVWSGFESMSGGRDKDSLAYYSLPANTVAIQLFHQNTGTEGAGRTSVIYMSEGAYGFYDMCTSTVNGSSFSADLGYHGGDGPVSGEGFYASPCSDWQSFLDAGTAFLYVYFWVGAENRDLQETWSARMTKIEGETNIYETEVPSGYGGSGWGGAIVVLHTGPSMPVDANKTIDIRYTPWYDAGTYVSVSNSYSGGKRSATASSGYTDEDRAERWGENFNNNIECSGTGTNTADQDKWSDAKTDFDNAASTVQSLIRNSRASSSGTELQIAVSKYDDIIAKYGKDAGTVSKTYEDILSRRGTPNYSGNAAVIPGLPGKDQSPLTTTLWIVLGAGLAGLAAIGTAYFVSKKKKRYQA